MELTGGPNEQQAQGTGELEELPDVGMLIASIGYKAQELNGMDQIGSWSHQNGRLSSHERVYLAGWLKVTEATGFICAVNQCVQRGATGRCKGQER